MPIVNQKGGKMRSKPKPLPRAFTGRELWEEACARARAEIRPVQQKRRCKDSSLLAWGAHLQKLQTGRKKA